MPYTTLVSVQDLAAHLHDADWVVCDCRHDLADYEAGRKAYAASHVPGARFLHLDEDLSGPKTGLNGRHPLPHPITLTLRLGALGIDNAAQVVAYDASGGMLWTYQYGTSASETPAGVALDGAGSVYVAGSTSGALTGTKRISMSFAPASAA